MPAPPFRSLTIGRVCLLAALSGSVAACAARQPRAPSSAPPRAELLVNTDDSTFWVTTTGGATQVRGVPLILAHYAGRFYELYTADDDFSFEDALLLGQRLYRRDLITGDSTMVFVDTAVVHVATAYAKAHPDERPLAPDEDGDPDPSTSATAEIDILDVFGPYLSYEYHVDLSLPGRPDWHATRRAVLDLRTGKDCDLAELFGAPAAQRIVALGRQAYAALRDSLSHVRLAQGSVRRAAGALLERPFDERSFTISDMDGAPAVSFSLAGRGEGAAGTTFDLPPLAVPASLAATAWWPAVHATLPATDAQGSDRWTAPARASRQPYQVVARYDTSGDEAQLSITDSSRREWPLVTVRAPIHRIDWLDAPPIDAATRRALTRAFNQAATYDENATVAVVTKR